MRGSRKGYNWGEMRKSSRRPDLWQILALPFLLFITLPVLALFLRLSPRDFLEGVNQRQVLLAIQLSLATSLTTVLLTLLFGTPVAYLLYRPRSAFSRLLDTLIDLHRMLDGALDDRVQPFVAAMRAELIDMVRRIDSLQFRRAPDTGY